jgi:hypothetical protein
MAALGQGFSLWAKRGSIGAATSAMKDLEGIAALARRFYGREQDLAECFAQRRKDSLQH